MKELREILTKLYCCAIAEHKAGKDSLLSKSLDNAEREILTLLPKYKVTPKMAGIALDKLQEHEAKGLIVTAQDMERILADELNLQLPPLPKRVEVTGEMIRKEFACNAEAEEDDSAISSPYTWNDLANWINNLGKENEK